jgi:hypothetical protein
MTAQMDVTTAEEYAAHLNKLTEGSDAGLVSVVELLRSSHNNVHKRSTTHTKVEATTIERGLCEKNVETTSMTHLLTVIVMMYVSTNLMSCNELGYKA